MPTRAAANLGGHDFGSLAPVTQIATRYLKIVCPISVTVLSNIIFILTC